jgi:quinol monooxygenase YgiN
MIERHITFDVDPAKAGQFEQFFAEQYRGAMAQSPGFVRVELLRRSGLIGRYEMAMRWQNADAATTWRTSSAHTQLQPALNSLVTTGDITVYEVIG